jgi:selenium metabolism protein YedF
MSTEINENQNSLDCRGLACPQPVILTKKALDQLPAEMTVLVDNLAAKENVAKFASTAGYGVSIEQVEGNYRLRLVAGTVAPRDSSQPEFAAANFATVFLLTRNTLGTGSEELGAILIKAFFVSLMELPQQPKAIMLVNSGVYLSAEGSPVLAALQDLSKRGVSIMVCGTCLDYFSLKDKLVVGSVTNMYSILTELTGAEHAITL